jgi:hypothetical protein
MRTVVIMTAAYKGTPEIRQRVLARGRRPTIIGAEPHTDAVTCASKRRDAARPGSGMLPNHPLHVSA